MTTPPPIPVTRPLLPPLEEFTPLLEEIWASGQLTNAGPMHQRLEEELARYLGVPHISLVANGTLALLLALEALDIEGEVITTPYTFVATLHALRGKGIRPVFVDINPVTLNIAARLIEQAITPATTAILGVHCYGRPCFVDVIEDVAKRHGLKVIYDAAHAFGVRDAGGSVLRHGDLSCLSFHATKVFSTMEGGAIVSPDLATKQRIDRLRNFGFVDEVTVAGVGINAKMSEVHAAFGLLQLRHVDAALAARARIAQRYRAGLAGVEGVQCAQEAGAPTNHGYFPILVGPEYPESRDALYQRLRDAGIHARRYFYPLASSFAMYADLPSAAPGKLPNAHYIAQQVLCLPIHPALADADLQRVIDLVAQSPHLPPQVKVTVAIPAYKPQFLEAALRSAVEQDFDSFEIVVCDDCRSDAVARVVQPYLGRPHGPLVRYLHNPWQLGEDGNIAKCVRLARGEYVRLLCDDDLLLPGTLAAQAAVLDARPDVSLVASRRTLVNETGHALDATGAWNSPFDQDVCLHGQDLVSFLGDCTINFIGEPSCAMFRRAPLRALGPKPMQLGAQPIEWLGDLTLHVHMLRQGHLALLQAPGASFRLSTAQFSHQGREQPGVGNTGHANFRRMLHELGWCRDGGKHPVRAAPLHAGEAAFQPIDLHTRIDRMMRGEAPAPTLQHWLEQRRPDAAQARLIEQHLALQSHLPRLAVFIQGTEGDEATRASLAPAHSLYGAVDVHPLPGADDPAWVAAFNAAAAGSEADWLLVVRAGETFLPGSLRALALALIEADAEGAGVQALGTDEVFPLPRTSLDADPLAAVFRPGLALDMLLAYPAGMARHWALRRAAVLEMGGLAADLPRAAEFDALLRMAGSSGLAALRHVAEPLLQAHPPAQHTEPDELAAIARHLHARGYAQAEVVPAQPGRYRIHYAHAGQPLVSIVIAAQGPLAPLQRCVETLLEKTAYTAYELRIVAHPGTPADTRAWLDSLAALGSAQLQVLQAATPAPLAALQDQGAQAARGDYLLFLSESAAALQPDWLHALLNHAQRPEVGITGAKLLRADGTVHHAGVVLGLGGGVAGLAFAGLPLAAPGYMHRLEIDQNYSTLGADCLMVRRSAYDEAGGLAGSLPELPAPSHALDFCLRVQQLGYLTVWTPHALLLHDERVPAPASPDEQRRRQDASDAFQAQWLPLIARDPAYNPHLALTAPGFQPDIDDGARWQPLAFCELPRVLAFPSDQAGCGHYRVMQPLDALRSAGLVDGTLAGAYYPTAVQMERMAPDTLVLQRQYNDEQLAALQRLTRFRHAFRVAELDDYILQLPQRSDHRAHQPSPQELRHSLRRWMAAVDRLVVSTPALAEALAGQHRDIRVVENRLPPAWWSGLQSQRRQGAKPRVGWAGGMGHRGDLELIADVVKTLADEVEWVFFGMCPEALRPYVHEYRSGGLPIAQYPAALARLNLDLAIAPLEQNLFNECKSNLRLLEYGACGYPVVCSDVGPYRGSLPVTRVRNRTRDWVDAIRAHLSDLDATARAGDDLRTAVLDGWMLGGGHLHAWRKAWLPD